MSIAARSFVVSACLVLTVSVATWVFTGAHRGWTKTKITEIRTEEVTGLEYPVTHDGFVMGVELLGASVVLAAVLGATGFWLGRKRIQAANADAAAHT